MGSAHTLVEALGLGLPGDRLVVDPDVPAAAVRSTRARCSTPGRG